MTKASSILKFIGEKFGANPETLPTTNKTLVGGLTEVANKATQNATNVGTLTTNVGTLTTNLGALTTRVDEIIAPSGEAPNPAEVVDARIGADGVTYNNLGTANRTQFSDVKSSIGEISVTFTDGYYVSGNNILVSSGSYSYSNYIPVIAGQKIHIINFFHDNPRMVFVDEAKIEAAQSVKQSIQNTNSTINYDEVVTVPNGASYLRISTLTAHKSKVRVTLVANKALESLPDIFSNKEQIEVDNSVTAFTGWEQGIPSDSTNTARVNIKLGYLKTGTIKVIRRNVETRYAIDAFSDSGYSKKIATTGTIADTPVYSWDITGGAYYAVTAFKNNYGDLTPDYVSDDYDVTFSRYLNDIVYDLGTTKLLYKNWTQDVIGQPQNLNRVSLFMGECGKGTLKVSGMPTGIRYGVDKYSDKWYQNRIYSSGWQDASQSFPVNDGEFVVIVGTRSNYSAIDSTAVSAMSIEFTSDTVDAIEKSKKNINALMHIADQNGIADTNIVPDYYLSKNYLDGKIAHINSLAKGCFGDGDVFAFITDMHWKLNAKNSPSLLNYMYHNTHIRKIFGGGDYSDSKNSDDSYFDVGSLLRDAWKGNTYYAIGNHEYLGSNASGITTENELAYDFGGYYGDEVVYGSKARNYFYVNNNGIKLRYVFLNRYAESTNGGSSSNDGLETAQLEWFENTALNVESGWSIIIVVHSIYGFNIISDNTIQPFITERSQPLVDILESYNGNGEIIAVVTGHSHMDVVMRLSNNIPVIITTCDKNKSGGETPVYADYWSDRPDGTINEQAFDVMVLNKTARTITAVRIGCPAMTWTASGNNLVRGDSVEERVITY